MISKNLRQSVTFQASPHEIYEILMDPQKHSVLTGSTVKLKRKVGTRFSCMMAISRVKTWNSYLTGKIIQSWHYADWPENLYSKVTFSLKEDVQRYTSLL